MAVVFHMSLWQHWQGWTRYRHTSCAAMTGKQWRGPGPGHLNSGSGPAGNTTMLCVLPVPWCHKFVVVGPNVRADIILLHRSGCACVACRLLYINYGEDIINYEPLDSIPCCHHALELEHPHLPIFDVVYGNSSFNKGPHTYFPIKKEPSAKVWQHQQQQAIYNHEIDLTSGPRWAASTATTSYHYASQLFGKTIKYERAI